MTTEEKADRLRQWLQSEDLVGRLAKKLSEREVRQLECEFRIMARERLANPE
jgi:hypothetical protein